MLLIIVALFPECSSRSFFFQHPGDKTCCFSDLSWGCSLWRTASQQPAFVEELAASLLECKVSVCSQPGSDILSLTITNSFSMLVQRCSLNASLQFSVLYAWKSLSLTPHCWGIIVTVSSSNLRRCVILYLSCLNLFEYLAARYFLFSRTLFDIFVSYCFIWFSQHRTGGNKAVFDGHSLDS